MANRLVELMKRPDRGARLAENVLTRAFRDMLVDNNIDLEGLSALVEVYLRGPDRKGVADNNKLANDRGNLKKELEKDEFTIKVFLKLVKLLRPISFSMTFNAEWEDGHKLNNGEGLTYTDLDNIANSDDDVDENMITSFKEEYERIKASRLAKSRLETIDEPIDPNSVIEGGACEVLIDEDSDW